MGQLTVFVCGFILVTFTKKKKLELKASTLKGVIFNSKLP